MTNRTFWQLLITVFVVAFLLYTLGSVLTPFLIAFFLAYMANPFIQKLVQIKIPRLAAIVIFFALLIIIIALLLFLLIPILENQILIFINKIPILINWIQQKLIPWINQKFGIQDAFKIGNLKQLLLQHWQEAGNVAATVLQTATRSGFTVFEFLINLILIPVVTFYLLRDWQKLLIGVERLFPRKYAKTVVRLLEQCNEVLGAFFRGQLLVMFSLGVYYAIALMVIGLETAVLLGLVIGLISIIPYMGAILGITMALLAAFMQFQSWHPLLYVVIIFIIGQILEGMVLSPLLVGERIGLHPVAVIFAILTGGKLFGFVGILLALPAAAVLMVLIRYFHRRYLGSKFYSFE